MNAKQKQTAYRTPGKRPFFTAPDKREADRAWFIGRCNFRVGATRQRYYWGIIRFALEQRL